MDLKQNNIYVYWKIIFALNMFQIFCLLLTELEVCVTNTHNHKDLPLIWTIFFLAIQHCPAVARLKIAYS